MQTSDCRILWRTAAKKIQAFLQGSTRKELLVTGARQVGKTTLIRQLGREAFPNFVELNFLENTAARKLFETASDSSDGWLAVGKPDADDCQQRCGRNRKCKPPGVLFRGLFCCGRAVLCTASAIGAERQIVVNLFTTMCTSHFGFLLVFVPVVLPGLPDLSYTITIGAAFCNVKTDFKKICRAQKNKKEPFAAPFYSVSDLCLFVPASVQ